ncbi:MAG: hypothetical protein PHQ27_00880 [Victivallales bacterium]|nr:hypothetical protein [Victivallales bacterium]
MALWLAPSANRHYEDWEDFAALMLELHRQYGFRFFKIDNIRLKTKAAEDNLEQLLRRARTASDGGIYFNLDATNGMRPGYFMFLEYGNIFLENRYVCHNWGVGYHPEHTLRNFWQLASYVRAQALQIEIPDPGSIDYEFYRRKKLAPPDVYPPDYWAAIAMFANPLLWLAPSRLQPRHAAIFRRIIACHRQYRQEIFAGEIFPLGSRPGSGELTGFQSHQFAADRGFIIVYRELQAPAAATLHLRYLHPHHIYRYRELAPATLPDDRTTEHTGNLFPVTLPAPGSWQMFRYDPVT